MAKCDFCRKRIKEYPRPCSYCKKFFCQGHRLPENHKCYGLQQISEQKKENFTKKITDLKLSKPTIISTKTESIKKQTPSTFSKMKNWLNMKSKHHNPKVFLKNFGMVIIYGIINYLIYLNLNKLNEFKIIIPLGGTLLICFVVLWIIKICNCLTTFQDFFESRKNWQKIIIVSIIIIIILLGAIKKDEIKNQVYEKIESLTIQQIFPLTIESNGEETEFFSGEGQKEFDNNIETTYENIAGKPRLDLNKIEYKIHELVNQERAKNGLRPLLLDSELGNIAEKHSLDMAENSYFSHDNLKGQGPTERAKNGKYSCFKDLGEYYIDGIAENIFQNNLYDSVTYIYGLPVYDWNYEEEIAKTTVDGWMDSPGHRKNILTSYYEKEGIGIGISEDDKVYITQNFC